MTKFVYSFEDAKGLSSALLGGKGHGLAEMTGIGLPVPPGITVTTEACTDYYSNGETVSEEIKAQIFQELSKLERKTGKTFGGKENPLLVSVRSGAKISMPGMMDTILNLGLNTDSVEALKRLTGNGRFAYDSYRRFIMMFSDVAIGIKKKFFDDEIEAIKEANGYSQDTEMTEEDLTGLCAKYKEIYLREMGTEFPEDPSVQLMLATEAIFRSWNNTRAITYRRLNSIPHDMGTAVTIQSMVFGNTGFTSGTGVAFTRNPATGEKAVFGEYLINAQGEDVVAGIRTPVSISKLKDDMPQVYEEFQRAADVLEDHYRDMQDIEFTIEDGKLFFLQTRNGKRTGHAALQVAVDLVSEGKLTKDLALLKIEAESLNQVMYPTFDPAVLAAAAPLASGLPASPGAAYGKVYFTAQDAVVHAQAGEDVILVRKETSPEDIEGMHYARGFLTARGGMTSHAAVVARGMGKCCVAGAEAVKVYEDEKYFTVGDRRIGEGEEISLNGTTGLVYLGLLKTVPSGLTGNFGTVMEWTDEYKTLGVRANADTPADARTAISFGAEGVGLTRTEHMFFEAGRILEVRKMICAETLAAREEALAKILPMQQLDFEGIFEVMHDKTVTIRLLDPPLHEFLPHKEEDIIQIADELGISVEKLKLKINDLQEFNPMLGHRGCRLSVTYPEIAVMQTRAIIQAALACQSRGVHAHVEIMVPLAGNKKELDYVVDIIKRTADETIAKSGMQLTYETGTMIEIPRAALISDELAETAEFFSFGTNDLTQMTLGFSRDDAGKFITEYLDKQILPSDPFQTIDQVGVGQLVRKSVADGRRTRPNLMCGVCGEHGGDPASIEFFHDAGLDYVSCSPYRVPIARLAAAQAAIRARQENK